MYKSNKSIILGDNNTIGKSSGSIIDDNTSGKNIIISGENNQAINEINTVIIGKEIQLTRQEIQIQITTVILYLDTIINTILKILAVKIKL